MSRLFAGLMSGTSMDGVDAALLELADTGQVRTLASASRAMPVSLRSRLSALARPGPADSTRDILAESRLCAIELTRLYAAVIQDLLRDQPATIVTAIGAHGQTVRHAPADGYSLQLIDGALLAELTQSPVVCDFRSNDIAAGGEGAPLVPAYHVGVFARPGERRAVLNIGGIANLTLIGEDTTVTGMDTGPGNTLLDSWIERHQGLSFDDRGAWADSGSADADLLEHLLAEPYFSRSAPKSTGRELFNLDWLDARLQSFSAPLPEPVDVQATLLELSVQSIAASLLSWRADRIIVCGGGVLNDALMKHLQKALSPVPCHSSATLGIDPQAVEASAFAWLAARRIDGLAGNLASVTGASGPRILGAIYAPPIESNPAR